jgi:hypothetical protein
MDNQSSVAGNGSAVFGAYAQPMDQNAVYSALMSFMVEAARSQ